jgi:hypothetical protein
MNINDKINLSVGISVWDSVNVSVWSSVCDSVRVSLNVAIKEYEY